MYYILFNPKAGSGRAADCLRRLREYWDAHGIGYEVGCSEYAGHSPRLVAEAIGRGFKQILTLGGDGTIYEAVNGLMSTGNQDDVTMGFLPGGSGNDFIRCLGLARDPVEAFRQIERGQTCKADLWQANNHYFINVLGMGLDTDVVRNYEHVRKFITGKAAYLTALLSTLMNLRFIKVHLTVDEQEYDREVVVLSVSNGRYFGSGIYVSPQADISDGLLDVVVINKLSKWRVPFLLPKYLKGKHLSLDICETFRGSHISIQPLQYDSFECDGEMFSAPQMDIHPAGRVNVLVGGR